MSAAERVAVALDVGGTSVKAGLVDPDGRLLGSAETFDACSDRDAESILSRFGEILQVLWRRAEGRMVAGIGVGMPGPFNYVTGTSLITGLGKYDAIYGRNLPDDWRRRLGLPGAFPIRFINDAAAFALGESLYGAGRGLGRVMAITLGTGCGGAFVVDGQIVTEGQGVPAGGEVYHLPFRGEITDEWISRRGILRLWRERNGSETSADVKDLAAAALEGDPAAVELFARWGEMLAQALVPVAREFGPQCLVLGGQIARSLSLFDQPLRGELAELGCVVAPSTDPAAGVRGAASLIWNYHQ